MEAARRHEVRADEDPDIAASLFKAFHSLGVGECEPDAHDEARNCGQPDIQ